VSTVMVRSGLEIPLGHPIYFPLFLAELIYFSCALAILLKSKGRRAGGQEQIISTVQPDSMDLECGIS
jgi:hypothetical protein